MPMTKGFKKSSFTQILERAEARKGGATVLKKLLPSVATTKVLQTISDDRYLAMMTKCINQAGFSWKVIENKWPQFEEAFFGFDVFKLGLLSPEQWEAYASDKRVVRNWQKIKALQENVYFVQSESGKHGGFGNFIAQWPADDQIGLMKTLKQKGSRLGGQSALWFLRRMGKDCFILSKDVVVALRGMGLDIAENPSSQRDLKKIQLQFNDWHEQTKLPYSHLSRILACSVGENYLQQ
ncbi:MAG: 3-methyladenine DNA glycosylase Tag [Pseudohongiellaceae bacterium]|jgi:3-methyladenine DNA glycosylase Tag